MPRRTSKGVCAFCHGEFGKGAIARHLEKCPARAAAAASGTPTRLLHLIVEGRDAPEYWMHIELPADATLTTLDNFLRDIWLECCGHLSAFRIGGETYESMVDRSWRMNNKPMRGVKLGTILQPGQPFTHEYDFGSTTELKLRMISEREAPAKGKNVQVLARNLPPDIRCVTCGQPAAWVCTECAWGEDQGWYCNKCLQEHECGDEMALPVVNSPRVGVCGYEG